MWPRLHRDSSKVSAMDPFLHIFTSGTEGDFPIAPLQSLCHSLFCCSFFCFQCFREAICGSEFSLLCFCSDLCVVCAARSAESSQDQPPALLRLEPHLPKASLTHLRTSPTHPQSQHWPHETSYTMSSTNMRTPMHRYAMPGTDMQAAMPIKVLTYEPLCTRYAMCGTDIRPPPCTVMRAALLCLANERPCDVRYPGTGIQPTMRCPGLRYAAGGRDLLPPPLLPLLRYHSLSSPTHTLCTAWYKRAASALRSYAHAVHYPVQTRVFCTALQRALWYSPTRTPGTDFCTALVVAIVLGLGLSWHSGAEFVIREKFSASEFWSDCAKYNVSVIQVGFQRVKGGEG